MKNSEKQKPTQESKSERASRFLRNVNALGALALGAAAVVAPVGEVVLGTVAGINAAQAGGFEWVRRQAQKKRLGKTKPK